MSDQRPSASPYRPLSRRGLLVAGAAVAADRLLGRPARAQGPGAPALVIAQGSDVSRLDPHYSTVVHDTAVSLNLFDTLVRRRHDNALQPSVATEWERTAPTTWRFALRRDVRFHNGDPLTSADVRFSVERAIDPKARTLVASVFATVDRVEASEPHVVLVHTKKPDPLLPARLAFFGGQILPRRHVEAVGADAFNAQPVGSGPVRFIEFVKGDRLVLERVPGYWGGTIDPGRVVFRPIPETGPRLAALLRGEVDLITTLPPDHVQRVATAPGTQVEQVLYGGLHLLVVDSRRPPLDNPRVKQAMSLAIDREAIVQSLWLGQGIVPNGPIPKGDNHYDPGLPPLAFDPGLARRRLREGGYAGEPIVLELAPGYLTNDRAMSEAVIGMWRDVGLNVQLEQLEYAALMQRVRERKLKGLRWGSPASPLGDPDGMMWRLLGPGGIHDTWRHPRFDELGQAAQVSVDEAFRGRAYREMTQIFLEHLPWIPVIQPIESYGLRRHVEWRPYPNQQLELRRFNLQLRPT